MRRLIVGLVAPTSEVRIQTLWFPSVFQNVESNVFTRGPILTLSHVILTLGITVSNQSNPVSSATPHQLGPTPPKQDSFLEHKARIVNLQKCQARIRELVARFVTEIKGETAMSRTDLNRVAESVLVPLFRAVYGYDGLRNLNHTERANFPGIDLADDTAKVAFQVTATSTSSKIKETLRTFSEAKLYERYSHLIVYILSERQRSYSGRGFEKYINGRFTFAKAKDIRDYRHLLSAVEKLPLDEALNVLSILEQHIGDKKPAVGIKTALVHTEPLYLNFVEIEFPSTLYLADLTSPLPTRRRREASWGTRLHKAVV